MKKITIPEFDFKDIQKRAFFIIDNGRRPNNKKEYEDYWNKIN